MIVQNPKDLDCLTSLRPSPPQWNKLHFGLHSADIYVGLDLVDLPQRALSFDGKTSLVYPMKTKAFCQDSILLIACIKVDEQAIFEQNTETKIWTHYGADLPPLCSMTLNEGEGDHSRANSSGVR